MKYLIKYDIVDGEHEYGDKMTARFDFEPTLKQIWKRVIGWWIDGSETRLRKEALESAMANGYFEIEGGCRVIKKAYVEKVQIPVIHLRGGCCVHVDHLENYEVRDHDECEIDEEKKAKCPECRE